MLLEPWQQFIAFLEAGGDVQLAIFAATALMWALIIDRIWFFWKKYPRVTREIETAWADRKDHSSWAAHQIRNLYLSQARTQFNQSLSVIKALVAVAPMLGLFGTVVGMIQVFDVMAIAGNGNPRAMAAGISQAILTTMAGMVAALSALYPMVRLQRRANKGLALLADKLETQHAP